MLISASLSASMDSILLKNVRVNNSKRNHLPGWNSELDLARENSLFWVNCQRPNEGQVLMWCVTQLIDIIHQSARLRMLVIYQWYQLYAVIIHGNCNSLSRNPSRDYWTEVKKISKGRNNITSQVNGVHEDIEIANTFADQ